MLYTENSITESRKSTAENRKPKTENRKPKAEKMESNSLVESYLKSLNEQERQTLEIAKDHLGASFHITKSIGFIKWNETHKISLKKEN